MNTCGTCRFFGAADHGRETNPRIPESHKLCGRIQEFDNWPINKSPESAVVVDGSGYFAALCVTTDFGCTEWKAKP